MGFGKWCRPAMRLSKQATGRDRPSFCAPLNNGIFIFYGRLGFFPIHTWFVSIQHSSPSGCLWVSANPSSFLKSVLWSMSFSTQPMHSTSRLISLAGDCSKVVQALCVGFCLFCLLQTDCCVLLQASEAPFPSWVISPPVWRLPRHNSSWWSLPGAQILSPCFSFLSLPSFYPTHEIFPCTSRVWDFLFNSVQ